MRKDGIVFVDVDTQQDFMNEDGGLYVPGAERIKENLRRLIDFAIAKDITIIATKDVHTENDPEFKSFPPHCRRWKDGMKGQAMHADFGLDKISETNVFPKRVGKLYSEDDFRVKAIKYDRVSEIISMDAKLDDYDIECIKNNADYIEIEKNTVDVLCNPYAEKIFSGIKKAFVFGVAVDYCVLAAVLGLIKSGVDVYIVMDAVASVGMETGIVAMDKMVKAGAKCVFSENVISENVIDEIPQEC